MKVKALKNFYMFDSTRIDINSVYEMKDEIAKDLENGGFVITISDKKTEKKIEEAALEKKAAPKKTTKKKTLEGAE